MASHDTPKYYTPYTNTYQEYQSDSESESGSDSSSDSGSSTSSYENTIARGSDDPRYAIIRAAGPDLQTTEKQLFYQMDTNDHGYPYNDWEPSTSNSKVEDKLLGTAAPKTVSTQTSLFSLTSDNRDVSVYPHSTFFTLKTPRTYRNVTQIQFVNINFPYFLTYVTDASSLFNEVVSYIQSNYGLNIPSYSNCYTCLGSIGSRGATSSLVGGSFSEIGRTNPVASNEPLTHTFTLSPGNYTGPSYAAEMDKQMNLTPPFNIISYAEHRQIFMSTKTVNHLFNTGGKWYYSISTKSYLRNATNDTITADYIPSINLENPAQPNEREIFVAYFYPVLKQTFSTFFDDKFLDFGSYTPDKVKSLIFQTFQGLSYPFYYEITYKNREILKSMRRMYTFEYYPINSYTWSYSPQTQKISVIHTDLHPSLKNEIQMKNNFHQEQAMGALGYNPHSFMIAKTKSSQTTAVVNDLANTLNKALAEIGGTVLSTDSLANPHSILVTQQKGSNQNEDDALFALTQDSSPILLLENRSEPYTFGSISISTLLQESNKQNMLREHAESPYSLHLDNLNKASECSRAGHMLLPNYLGVNVSCKDFSSLYSTFLNYYSTNTGLAKDIQTVHTKTTELTSNFINTKYNKVLPSTILSNNAYMNNTGTGGVTFHASRVLHYASTPAGAYPPPYNNDISCCAIVNGVLRNFYGCLPANYLVNTVYYQLGFGGNDILSFYTINGYTTSPATHNIYLQLNLEQPLNGMDVAKKENYNISNETNSEYKLMLGKLLTRGSSVGAYTQTIVQVPAKFAPSPLASIDHFTFRFFLDDMVPLDLLYPFQVTGTQWDGIIQIDEQVAILPPLSQ